MKVAFFLALAGLACSQVTLHRDVTTINHAKGSLTFDRDCKAKDQYGSNDCTFAWESNHTASLAYELDEEITGGTLSVDAKIEGIFPLIFHCPACGGICNVSVAIGPIKKEGSFPTPPCPIKTTSGSKALPLNIGKSLGLTLTVEGDALIVDQNQAEVLKMHFKIGIEDPSGVTVPELKL